MHANPGPSVETSHLDKLQSHLEAGTRQGRLELPLLPQVASQALGMTADRRSDAAVLSALIHRDQALAGHVLRLANSAAFGGRSDIVSLRQAVAWLGMELLAGLIVDVAMRSGLFRAPGYEQETRQMWQHALTSGFYARAIARMRRRDGDTAFLCGLLRDIGKPVVLRAAIQAIKKQRLNVEREDLLAMLEELNRPAGIHLAQQWTLPTPVIDAIRYEADEDDGSEGLSGPRVAFLGSRLATLLLSPDEIDEQTEPWDPRLSEALELGTDAVKDLLEMGSTITDMVASVSPGG